MADEPSTPLVLETPAAAPWYASLDAEHQGHLQNKGWDKLDPTAAALELTKAWKGAEKLIGIPKDELLRLPKQGDAEAEKAFWSRLGAKEKPEEYDFSNLKFKDGQTLDEEFMGMVRTAAHELHLPADKASAFVQKVMGHMDDVETKELASVAVTRNLEVEKLNNSWGPNKDMNMDVAQRAAGALGVTPEAVTALEGVVGYAKVMEMFRDLGSKMGEARYVENDGGKAPQAMTYEMAVAEKASLLQDHVFRNNWINNGDRSPERLKMDELNRLIASNPDHFRR